MNTLELKHLGLNSVPNFIGVFPIDHVPNSKLRQYSFIVNNQSSNLPGQHWIAVSIKNRHAYIFDPLGMPPPYQLTKSLHGHEIKYNTVQYQPANSNLCGQFALSFLINNSDNKIEDIK